MLVEIAVLQVIDDLMEASAAGPFSTAHIIDKLNEGYLMERSRIIARDPQGQWFGAEATANYPASTRWAPMGGAAGTWSPSGTPDEVYSLKAIVNKRPCGVDSFDLRDEEHWIETHDSSTYGFGIMGAFIGLRVGGSYDPPTTAVSLRMKFLPPATRIDRTVANWATEKAKVIGVNFPFPEEFASLMVAWATVLLTVKQESQAAAEWKGRYGGLEDALLERIRRNRQKQDLPEVRMEAPELYWY